MLRKHGIARLVAALTFAVLPILCLSWVQSGPALAEPSSETISMVSIGGSAAESLQTGDPGDADIPGDLDGSASVDSDPSDASTGSSDDGSGGADVEVPAGISAILSLDQRRVELSGQNGVFDDAQRVVFRIWNVGLGRQSQIEHEAVRLADGSWGATAFIAANDFAEPGVPYNCQVPDAVHRLYNPYTGQHHLTMSASEADGLSRAGWRYEGVAWAQPAAARVRDQGQTRARDRADGASLDATDSNFSGAPSESPATDAASGLADASGIEPKSLDQPVYRLYNPYNGDHFFTVDSREYASLPAAGWRQEGVAFRSRDDGDPSSTVAVYRLYNPNLSAGSHLFTSSANEYRTLVAAGWSGEGVAWHAAAVNGDGTWCARSGGRYHDSAGTYRVEALVTPGAPASGSDADVDAETGTDGTWLDDSADAASAAPTVEVARDGGEAVDGGAATTVAGSTGSTQGEAATTIETSDGASATAQTEAVAQVADVVVGEASFIIASPVARARVANVGDARGTYDVFVDAISSPSGVAHVYVPTWTDAGGQDDLVWYEAARQGDGSYKATVSVGHHTFDHDFTSHVYVRAGNGIMANVAQLSQRLTFANFIRKSGGPYTYTLSIYNPGASRVQLPTWSDEGWQDDIVWYEAKNDGSGWWSATVEASRLGHSGVVHTHFYVDGALANAIDYTVQPWEILAWRFRNMNDRVRGLSSPTGYLLAVDTSNCFMGVYEGSRGDWRNRCWWDCAPGTRATPTVKGVFSIGARGYSFGHGYTCYYWTQFFEDYWFHSIKYYEGTFDVLDGTLGAPASLGCVRLSISNARWINENIPSRTTVLVY